MAADIVRGGVYRAHPQGPETVGLLVVSNNRANTLYENVTVTPVLSGKPVLSVQTASGNVDYSLILQIPKLRLGEQVAILEGSELTDVSDAVADLLMIPELCADSPRMPDPPPSSKPDYPRWGKTYYAQPALGGETKRWLVVSHDDFNSTQERAICVRTTSRTDYPADEIPLIQSGFAAAVCTDITNKELEMFSLGSEVKLDQAKLSEMTPVARAIVNYLSLHSQAGY